MKLHIPLKLLAALLACVMHTSYATGVVTIPDNATDEQVAAAKAELATPTLTGLYNQDSETYTTKSAYQLVEVTGDVAESDFTITKYLKTEDSELTEVTYNVDFNVVFGNESGDNYYYYSWTEDEDGNLTLVATTDASEADIVYINSYDSTLVSTSRLNTSTDWVENSAINTSFVGCSYSASYAYGGAIYNTAAIGDITGDFIGNSALSTAASSATTSSALGGAIYNTDTMGDITGDFIDNYSSGTNSEHYSYSYGGAIYNSGTIGVITGDFIDNYSRYSSSPGNYASGGAIYNSGTITSIIGDFISNHITSSYITYLSGGAIYNRGSITNITGNFIGNYIVAKDSSDVEGGAIYNYSSATIESITGDFIGNYIIQEGNYSVSSICGAAIYNAGTINNITGDFIGNFISSSSAATVAGSAISNFGTIGAITGDFIGNYGGSSVIYNEVGASIGSITGDFIGNYDSDSIRNYGSISSIEGDFINNDGGYAICNISFNSLSKVTIGTITCNFIGSSYSAIYNYIYSDGVTKIGSIMSDFINNSGSAIYNYSYGYLQISSITGDFIDNSSSSHGGAIYNESFDYLEIISITSNFYNNSSSNDGGAIYNYATNYGVSVITSITGDFIDNSASSDGGAIVNYASGSNASVEISSITGDFIENYASGFGGAIYNTIFSAGESLIGSILGDFIDNSATNSGGAIYNSGTIESITGDFTNNQTYYYYGGAIYNSGTINNIIGDFIDNSARYSGGAIFNQYGTIESITGDFISNTNSSSSYNGGAIFNQYGTIESITGNFIGNSSNGTGGAIFNQSGTLSILAQDNDILFSDNTATTGEAIYNTNAIIYLIAYNDYSITFNDTIYNTGTSANITIGELDSEDYTGNVVLNALFYGNGIYETSSLTLASGTLAFGYYTDSDNITSYGSISNTKLIITGGAISTADGNISSTSLGFLTLTATETCWSLDIDLTTETADTLTASSVSGSGSLMLDGINILGSTEKESITVSLTTNSSLKASISTDLTGANFLINGINAYNFSAVSYDATTGQLTISITEAMSINDLIASTDTIKQYQFTSNLSIVESLGTLAGTSMSIFGQGYNITADGSDIEGITIDDSTQTLTITDVALWSGFSDNAVTNNAGTLSITASSYDSTWEDSIVNDANMNVCAAEGQTVTFNDTVTGTGTLELNDADNSGSIIFNAALTQDEIIINAGSVSVNGTVTGDITMLGGSLDMNDLALSNDIEVAGTTTISNGSAYMGQLTLTSGSLAGDLNLAQTLLVSAGEVTADLTGSAGIEKSGWGTVTLSGNLTYTGATSVLAGELIVNGTSATSGYSVSSGASLSLINSSISLNDSSITGYLTATNSELCLSMADGAISIGNNGSLDAGIIILNGNNTLTISDWDTYKEGTYLLLGTSGILGDVDNLTLDTTGLDEGYNYELSLDGNNLVLTLDEILYAADSVFWNDATGIWTSDASWQDADGKAVLYEDGASVTFNGGTITLNDTVNPGDLTVTGSNDTSISGTGSIAGDTSLTKSGSGTLSLNTANSYTGGTTVEAGTLTLGNVNAAGTGDIALLSGTLNLSNLAVANDIEITGATTITNGSDYAGQLTLNSGSLAGSLNLSQNLLAYSGTVSASLSGSSGVVVNGVVTLSGANSYTGDTTVESGTLTLLAANAAGESEILLKGGTLDLSNLEVFNNIELDGTAAITNGSDYKGQLILRSGSLAGSINLSQDLIVNGLLNDNINLDITATLSGSAGIVVEYCMDVTSNLIYSYNLSLYNSNTYSGGTTINYGYLGLYNVNAAGTGDITLNNATLVLNNLAVANDITATGDSTILLGSEYLGQLTVNASSLYGSINLSQDMLASGGEIYANLSGTAGIVINGDVTLSSSNSYTGDTTLETGTLTLKYAESAGTSNIVLAGGTLDMNSLAIANDVTVTGHTSIENSSAYSGQISLNSGSLAGSVNLSQDLLASSGTITADLNGTAGLQKIGTGTVTLTGNADYTGSTSVLAGTLVVEVETASNAFSVSKGASLQLDGSTIDMDLSNIQGSLTLNNSDLLMSSTDYSMGSLDIGTGNDLIIDNLSSFEAGSYTIITTTSGITGDLDSLVLDITGTSALYNYELTLVNSSLVLNVIENTDVFTWSGGDANWTDEGAWSNLDGDASTYEDGMVVSFNGGVITLDDTVEPATIVVDSADDTTITGAGSIAGETSISKYGEGTLTLDTANSYTGGTTVTAGTLVLGDASAAGTGLITLDGGELNMSDLAVANDITITGDTSITDSSAYTGQITMSSGSLAGDVNLAQDLLASSGTVSATLSGNAGVIVDGSVTLSGANSYTGDTVVEQGSLTLSNASAAGTGDIVLEGGSLNLSNLAVANDISVSGVTTISNGSDYAGQITLSSGSLAGDVNLAQDLLASTGTISATLSGSAGVVIDGAVTLSGANSYTGDTVLNSGTLTLTQASAAGSGDITLNAGVLDLNSLAVANDITVTADASLTQASSFAGDLSIAQNAILTVTDGDLTLGASFNNSGTLDATAVDLSFTGGVDVDGTILATDITMSGDNSFATITAAGDISNSGTLTLSADSSMKSLSGGGSLVANANVEITGDTATSLTQLSGSGSLTVATDLSLSTQSSIDALSVGGDLTLAAGLTVTNTLSLDGSLSITDSLNINTPALSVGNLSVDGSLNIIIDNQSILDLNLSVSDTYELISVADDYTGTVTLNGSSSFELEEGYSIAIGVIDGSIQLYLQTTNNFWSSEDGTWGSGEGTDWTQGDPSFNVDAVFFGKGASEVTLVGEQSVGNTIINSDSQDYTFSGDKLSTSTLQIIKGGLTIANEVEVSSTVTLGEDGSLNIAQMGTLIINGALSAEDMSIVNNGSLSFGQGSIIGSITGTGINTATGDVTIGSLETNSDLIITGTGTEATVNSDTILSSLSNEGLLNLGSNTLTIDTYCATGGSITAAELTLNNGGSFDDLITDVLTLSTLSNSSYGLFASSISALNSALVELDISALSSSTTNDTYQILASTGDDFSWDQFTLSDATATAINELIINEGKTISYLVEDGNLSLSIADAPDSSDSFIWDVSSEIANSDNSSVLTPVFVNGQLASYDALDQVTQVNVSTSVELDLTSIAPSDDDDSVLISNMNGFADATLSIVGNGVDADSVTLYNDTKTVAQNAVTVEKSTLIVDNAGSDVGLTFGALELDSANLTVVDGASLTVDSIDSSALSVIEGDVTIVGDESSKLLGSYVDSTLNFQTSASALVYVSDADELSLEGSAADIQLISASGNAINSFNLTDSTLTVGTISEGESFTISEASSMSGGTLAITVADSVIGSGSTTAMISGASVNLDGTNLAISSAGSSLDISSLTNSTGIALFTLTEATATIRTMAITTDTSDSVVSVDLVSGSISKYFTNATYVNGVIYADLNTNSYGYLAKTNNGAAGLNMMNEALLELNPQLNNNGDSDLASALDGLDTFKAAGASDAADTLGAAIAGASVTSLGSAAQADIARQLRSIRSRSKNAGLANATILESNGGAWISAEGGNSSLSSDGTVSGHDLTSVGGSIGAEANVGDAWRVGAAFTLVKGDLSSDAPDRGDADLTTYYASLYANTQSGNWTHNVVALIGKIDASMERTVTYNTAGDDYKTKGDTDGMSFALSYEVGYSYDLDEEATSTLQPLFAISYVNSSINGYTEDTSSDAALIVGDQDNSYFTVGIGVQYDTIIGAQIYNRESLLFTRIMLNVDAGDRTVEADVKLAAMDGSTQTIKGTEPGAVGLEFGLGLDVPVSESSSLFIDASCEFRSEMTDISAGIGYRFSF